MSEEKYNGWANYETWLVGLWLDNDEATYNYWRGAVEECKLAVAAGEGNPYADSPEQGVRLMLAERLQSQLVDTKDDLLEANNMGASLWADLLGAALGKVDWFEVADHISAE